MEQVDQGEQIYENIGEKIVVPPPIVKKIEALEFTDPTIPGELVIDQSGKLLKRWFTYEGTIGSLVDQYNNFITNVFPEQLASRTLKLPSGEVTFENVLMNRPIIKTATGGQIPLYPNMCRDSGYSYTGDIYVDLVLNKGSPAEERIEKAFLGKIPVMLGSTLDWLTTKSEKEVQELGEGIGENTGYFVIKGAEKIVLIQEKLRANRFFCFNSTSKGDVVVKITNNTLMGSTQITMARGKKSGALKLHLGFMKRNKGPSNKLGNTMSVFQIYRMLGVNDPSDILKYISLFTKPEYMKKIFVALQPSFVKLSKIGDDIEYVSKKMGLGNIDYSIRKADIMRDLINQLFPQVPSEALAQKLYMLSIMTVRLLECLTGFRELDDRDNWGNKQLVTAGKSLELLFSSIWREGLIKAQDEIDSKKLSGLKAAQRSLDPSFVTDNFIESFTANKWGVQSSFMAKENITDFLKRDSILSVFSHLTKINTPTSRKAKSQKIRMVQMSQLGYVDPAETQEGENCLFIGTPVLMADGTYKPIGKIVEGDEVITVNPVTLETSVTGIIKPFTFHTKGTNKRAYEIIASENNYTEDKTIIATGDHPFLTQRGWVKVDNIQLTDKLCILNDKSFTFGKIKSIKITEDTEVSDFTTLSDNHSFIANGFVTHNCGLSKNSSMTNYISLDRPESVVIEKVIPYLSNLPTEAQNNPFILNGVFRGWVNGVEVRNFMVSLRRGLKLAKDTAIVLERDGTFNIYTDSSRPTRPLMIVDPNGKLVIENKNLWDADFDTLLREGCVEYIDAWEQDGIMLAQNMENVNLRQSQIEQAIRGVKEAEEKLSSLLSGTRINTARSTSSIYEFSSSRRGENLSSNERDLVEDLREEEKNLRIMLSQAQFALKELIEMPRYTHSEMDPSAIMSLAVGVIPLPETNPGTRLTYQSGMGKQALGIYHSNHASRFDTTSKLLAFPSRPMFETQMNAVLGLDELPAGETVILAITTYGGWAQEDAIIMSKSAIDRGLFRSIIYKTYKLIAKKNSERFARPEIEKGKESRYEAINENGIPRLGSFVKEGDCLIGKVRKNNATGKWENASSFVDIRQEGVVDRVLVSTNQEGNRIVKVKIRQVRKPILGDKFSSRYAQKGTIGMILNDEDMPFTADGVRPDLIINPMCFVASTPVSTYKGYSKRIADFSIEGSEKLWAWDETKRSYVISSSLGMESKGVKQVINVYLQDGRIIKCTPNHKFLTVDKNVYSWVEAKDLQSPTQIDGKIKLNVAGSRIVCGLEMPLDKPEEDFGSTWSLTSADYTFDMTTDLNREKALAFARILGYTLTDGCVSAREDLTHGYASTLNMGHDIDAQAVQEDIFLITGKKPTYTLSKGTVNIRLPASLSGAIGWLEGVQSGVRASQEVSLPEFLNAPNCPKSVIREFLGGMFGGDGVAPCISRNLNKTGKNKNEVSTLQPMSFIQSSQITYIESLKAKMENIRELLAKLDVKSRIDGPHEIYYNSTSYPAPKDGVKRNRINVTTETTTDFALKVGVRYCIQKANRLSAAASYWRYQEEIARQHDWVIERTNEIYESGVARQRTNKKSIPVALEMARKELIANEPVINEHYSLSNVTDIHNRRNKGTMSSKGLKRFEYKQMMNVEQFFEKANSLHWFQREDQSKMDYIVKRDSMVVPNFQLEVIGMREAGEEEVFDIGVEEQHNFLAHGLCVHNCIPSRMTIGKLIEIVTSKVAAFTGERINATAFRRFNPEEFMQNLTQYGFSSSGKERMYSGFTGKPLEARIFIGPCYYQALRHQVVDKAQMRARGGITQLTHQPVQGLKRGGGQRVGEMERDAIISHGASAFLQERLCLVSDAYETVYCSTCGTIAISNVVEDKYVCRTCEDEAKFGVATIPYAFKLLSQLLAGANFNIAFKMCETAKK
jgi:DNA-directed RNA polymerase beta subunit/intein/homing endonuclease